MKHVLFLTLPILLTSCTVPHQHLQQGHGVSRIDALLAEISDPNGPAMVAAHRACWIEGQPENSLPAIDRCVALGVGIIEIDVQLTADGVPVLMHDETVDRTSNGKGRVDAKSYAELAQLRLRAGGGGADAPLTNDHVPTLEAALTHAKGMLLVNVDAKADVFYKTLAVAEAVGVARQVIMKMGVAPADPRLVNAPFVGRTMFMPIIRECTALDVARNCVPRLSLYIPEYRRYAPSAYEIIYSDEAFLKEGIGAIRAAGGRAWVNVLSPEHAAGRTDALALRDPDKGWGEVIALGGGILQTDYPARLTDYLQARKRKLSGKP